MCLYCRFPFQTATGLPSKQDAKHIRNSIVVVYYAMELLYLGFNLNVIVEYSEQTHVIAHGFAPNFLNPYNSKLSEKWWKPMCHVPIVKTVKFPNKIDYIKRNNAFKFVR